MMNFIPFVKLLNYQPMYVAFGFTNSQPVFIGLIIVIMYILTPLNTVSNYIIEKQIFILIIPLIL